MTDTVPPPGYLIVVFSESDLLRLIQCPPAVIVALKALFGIRTHREEIEFDMVEVRLKEKDTWADLNKMDVELMAIIRTLNRFGYHPITSSTFGRLPQDNLSLIFIQTSAPSTLFGIRFNKLSLRVIDLPQNQAPGVLSVVRSAWPLGIASEEQKADNVYEFSLKGHGLSPDSNHDRDSLTLVLNLLSGLPAQFCNLVMSVSLNRKMARSETRDFWLFEGLPPIRPPPLQIAQTYSMGARGAPLRYPVSRSTETLMPPAGSDEASDIVNHCGLVY